MPDPTCPRPWTQIALEMQTEKDGERLIELARELNEALKEIHIHGSENPPPKATASL